MVMITDLSRSVTRLCCNTLSAIFRNWVAATWTGIEVLSSPDVQPGTWEWGEVLLVEPAYVGVAFIARAVSGAVERYALDPLIQGLQVLDQREVVPVQAFLYPVFGVGVESVFRPVVDLGLHAVEGGYGAGAGLLSVPTGDRRVLEELGHPARLDGEGCH